MKPWVCLMYHDVQPAMPRTGGGPGRFAVPLTSFELMLDTINDTGYRGCSLSDVRLNDGRHPVAITFDDGTDGQYEHAVPALCARGMTATFFITTSWIGRPGFMTWEQVREIAAMGMSVQSHTVTHPFLSELSGAELRSELAASKAELDDRLGQDTDEISLPGGDAPAARLHDAFSATGYRVVAGSRWGINHGLPTGSALIRRCTLRGDLTVPAAQRIISGDARLGLTATAREAVLATVRSTLGPSRYAKWRRVALDAFS